MTQTFEVYRITLARNATGGYTKTEGLSHAIMGRLSTRTKETQERWRADKREAETQYFIYCMAGQDVKRGDILKNEGRRFRVLVVQPVRAMSNLHHLRVDVEELQVDH
jgi:hypothetical protein